MNSVYKCGHTVHNKNAVGMISLCGGTETVVEGTKHPQKSVGYNFDAIVNSAGENKWKLHPVDS